MKAKSCVITGGVSMLALALAMGIPASQANAADTSVQKQIKALQRQIDELKAQQAATQHRAMEAEDKARSAASKAAIVVPKDSAIVTYAKKDGFNLGGGVHMKVGGFLAAEGVYRNHNETGDIGSSFSSGDVPFRGGAQAANDHQSEFRGTARQSRLSLMFTGDASPKTHLSGYFEFDFLGQAGSANSKESNSYTPRIRQVWAGLDELSTGLHVYAGQTWTLATLEKKGLLPLAEDPPLTIDASYVPGFTYLRNPELRVVKDFGQKYWIGLAIDNPQTLPGGSAPGTVVNFQNAGTGFGFNSAVNQTNNFAPDITLKGAVDTAFGHFELFGLTRFFEDRTSISGGTSPRHNEVRMGWGVGGGAIIPVVPKMVDFQISGLYGKGTGRYGATQLPDVTYEPNGAFKPLENLQAMAGVIGHVTSKLDLYAYAGLEQVHSTTTGAGLGYGGGIAGDTSGCLVETAAAATCSLNFHRIEQVTVGDWWKIYSGSFGSMRWGLQYSATRFDAFQGATANSLTPHTIENQIYTSFRFYPFE